jgi:deoxycytidine triphosphate deaminase
MQAPNPAGDDPLADAQRHPDAYRGAVLLSDQMEFYIKHLEPPLLARPDGARLTDDDLAGCLDTASYKLRLGDEAHVGGVPVRVSHRQPLVLPPHQVAVVKTFETVNVPRFLVARWNLRVKWVYEGLLWVGGPQVDPGWTGALYCPIYNLAERTVVVPYMEPVFTMDFTRTTPVHNEQATYGYRVKPHTPARQKNLQGHDVNRLRSAPFEELRRLATLDNRINAFIPLMFVVLSVIIAAIGAVAALNVGGANIIPNALRGNESVPVLSIVAVVISLSALLMSSIAMYSHFDPIPSGRTATTIWAIIGTSALAFGSSYAGVLVTRGQPQLPKILQTLVQIGTWGGIAAGIICLSVAWWRATRAGR